MDRVQLSVGCRMDGELTFNHQAFRKNKTKTKQNKTKLKNGGIRHAVSEGPKN